MTTWYKIFNTGEFDALDLVSKTYTLNLQNIGLQDILVTKGNSYGILFNDVFLQLKLNDMNPFTMDGYSIFGDTDGNVFLGIISDEN